MVGRKVPCGVTLNLSNFESGSIINKPTNIINFPNGESDFSIYREADGGDTTIRFEGFDFGNLQQINNTLDFAALVTGTLNGTTTTNQPIFSIVSPEDTEYSIAATAAYNSTSQFRKVKEEFDAQNCPRSKYTDNLIDLGKLSAWVKSVASPTTLVPLEANTLTIRGIRTRILSDEVSIEEALSFSNIDLKEEFKGTNGRSVEDDFYRSVLDQESRNTSIRCRAYYRGLRFVKDNKVDLPVSTLPPLTSERKVVEDNRDGYAFLKTTVDFYNTEEEV